MERRNRIYYQAVIIILFVLIPFFGFSQTKAKVIKVKDGDTVVVLLEGNIQKTLRLAEVDCPESGQPFGKNAKQFTSDKVFGKEITFEETSKDRYGRSIAKIYYSNKYLSREIIRAGLGWWYYKYSNNKALGKLQEKAQEKKLGLWQDKNAISPWEFRKNKRQNNLHQ